MAGCSPTSPWTHPRTTNPSPAAPDGLPCIGSTVRDVLRHHSGALGRIRTCNLLIRRESPSRPARSPGIPICRIFAGHRWCIQRGTNCLLYTSDAADEEDSVDLGVARI